MSTVGRRTRPQSAMSRPPSTAGSRKSTKTDLQKAIDGDSGPPMTGVTTYPFSRAQRHYLEDFRSMVATSITHPSTVTTKGSQGSVPHNLVSGSNFDEDTVSSGNKFKSEYKRSYLPKSAVEAYRLRANGLRSEEMMFVG